MTFEHLTIPNINQSSAYILNYKKLLDIDNQ